MKTKHPPFTADGLTKRIAGYFIYIRGEYHHDDKPDNPKTPAPKIWDREPEPATITGLAYFLGFSSRQAYISYEQSGKHARILQRGTLQIEHEYEKKLHQQATGIIFALKSLGWGEKADDKAAIDEALKTLLIKIIETGPPPAATEKEAAKEIEQSN